MLCFNHIDLQDYKLILCMQGVDCGEVRGGVILFSLSYAC